MEGQDGTGPLADPVRAWRRQHTGVRRTCQSLTPSDRVSEASSAEKEDPTPSEGLLGLWFFSFLQHVTPAPPWSIKGRAGHPAEGEDQLTKKIDRYDSTTHTMHTAKQRPSSWRPFDHSIRDLGPFPLSTVCTLYYEPFSVLITRAAAD